MGGAPSLELVRFIYKCVYNARVKNHEFLNLSRCQDSLLGSCVNGVNILQIVIEIEIVTCGSFNKIKSQGYMDYTSI